MNHTWTPDMIKASIVLAVIFMAMAVYFFRKDKAFMLVVCFFIFYGFVYQPALQMQQQECEQAKAQARQATHTVHIWLGPVLITSTTTGRNRDE